MGIFGAKWRFMGICGKSEMLLTGSFSRAVDEKLRVALPKRFRLAMGCPDRGLLYLTPGWDKCVEIYTQEALTRLAQRLAAGSPSHPQVRDFARLFYGQTHQVELDAQGRVRIPKELADWAQLQTDVILIGVQDHVELWSKQRWEVFLAEKQPHFDQIAQRAFDPPTAGNCLPPSG